jgi:endonuclease/exonuclease/phosphatase family metal-dependent hydrolase
MLIAGDFNDWNDRLAPLFVQQLGVYEVFANAPRKNQLSMKGAYSPSPPPRTFPSAFPWLRLDRMYQRGFAVRNARVLRGRPWSQLSDHSPIFAELELP